ncbi:MAG: CDP-alcohol phosphatidyltransferase family protein, partial [Treponemataceae bacterium]|nr:CDP-alcohol phosphatidyltransferase family protein [Treponemataceae bacterium]
FIIYNLPIWAHSVPLARASAWILIPLLAIFELTDYFDGHYARKNGEVSDFGKLFDPFADVILNITVFFCALHSFAGAESGYLPTVILILIVYREFSITFLRMIATKEGIAIAARKGGKLKTVFYIASGFFFLALESALRLGVDAAAAVPALRTAAVVLFAACLVLSYVSFIDYVVHFSSVIKKNV